MTFKTMLAGKAVPEKLRFPLLVSPKLDGVRAHIIDGVVVSRNQLPFKNPEIQRLFGHRKYDGLDGEFMVGDPTSPEAFRQTGVLNSHSGSCAGVQFHVFDDFTLPTLPFHTRLQTAHDRIARDPGFVAVPHYTANSIGDLDEMEAAFLSDGYEGAMVRSPDGKYKYGRSTTNEGWLLKVKRFEDSEAVIDSAEELMHNANEKTLVKNGKAVRNSRAEGKVGRGVLGTVGVRDIHTGVSFFVGSGFDDAERSELWRAHSAGSLVGRVIKYQYFPGGSKDKPRFPTFLGFRAEGDL